MAPDAPTRPESAPPGDQLARIEQAITLLSQMHAAPQSDKVEPIIRVLLAVTMVLVVILVVISKWSPGDGQTFQVVAGLATGFGGAVLVRVKPAEQKKPGEVTQSAANGGAV